MPGLLAREKMGEARALGESVSLPLKLCFAIAELGARLYHSSTITALPIEALIIA